MWERWVQEKPFLTRARKEKDERRKKERRGKEKEGGKLRFKKMCA